MQLVVDPTRNGNTLDLLVTNIPSMILRTEVIPGVSDHDIVYSEIDINPVRNKQKPRQIPLYKKARWDSLKSDISSLHGVIKDMSLSGSPANDLWVKFSTALNSSIESHIPHKLARSKHSSPWITHEIKVLIRKRDRLFKKKKKSAHPGDIKQFKETKYLVQKKLRQAYWNYIEGNDSQSTTNKTSKRFWTYIKHRKSDKVGIAALRKNGIVHTDPINKATILNQQFQSAFTEKASYTQDEFEAQCKMPPNQYTTSSDITFDVNGIAKLLSHLSPHKAAGPDNIRPRILKELAHEIAPILSIIFTVSYETRSVPKEWLSALVTPVYKKGQKYLAENYRPISLTCVSCKVMEHIVTSHIMRHAEQNNILYPLQHGFRSGRSCKTQLIEFIDDVSSSLESGKQTDILVMDFSKAFDKVCHSLLTHKLRHYGIGLKSVNWISAFLSDRSQSVVTDGEMSEQVPVESGVPQGSVLGPSLFLYYVNDLPANLRSTVRLFADDTIAYLTITSAADCHTLQSDLDKLSVWEKNWKMAFHPAKCNVLSVSRKKKPVTFDYHLHGNVLEHVQSAKYLGCTITSDLDWHEHISNICSKANNTLGFLRRNLYISSVKIKEQAYKSLVRPSLEYASSVWDPYEIGDINQLEMVQRRAARFVCNRYRNRSSVGSMLDMLEWEPLQTRRKVNRLTMLYKINQELVAIQKSTYLKPVNKYTRNSHSNSFMIPTATKNYRKESFFHRTIREWNSIPPDLLSSDTPEAFKTALRAALV